jgi:hypothetical protein
LIGLEDRQVGGFVRLLFFKTSHDTAEVHIIVHKGEQPHIIKLNVEALKSLPPGKHDVVFSVTALDQARVFVDGQSK